jgi:hypothetical protein
MFLVFCCIWFSGSRVRDVTVLSTYKPTEQKILPWNWPQHALLIKLVGMMDGLKVGWVGVWEM